MEDHSGKRSEAESSNINYYDTSGEKLSWVFDYHPQPDAPPSYREAVGDSPEYSTTETPVAYPTNQSLIPQIMTKLTYADFLPKCFSKGTATKKPLFENFDMLIFRANEWLRANPSYQVKNCETLERKLDMNTFIAETETTLFLEPSYGTCSFIKVLRLWFTPRDTPNSVPDQIGCVNVVPNGKELTAEMYAGIKLPFGGASRQIQQRWTFRLPIMQFETMNQTVEKLNENFEKHPLPGTIINIETSNLKYAEGFDFSREKPHPSETYYYSTGSKANIFVYMLRVFYLYGPSMAETIGIQDFVPEITKFPVNSIGARPKWETMSDVLTKAGQWIFQNNVNVKSVQTVDYEIPELSLDFINEARWKVDTNKMQRIDGMEFQSYFARVIRVCFTKSPPEQPRSLSWSTFPPARLGLKHFETSSQNVNRITAWLNLTGARILSVETYNVEERIESVIDRTNESTYLLNRSSGKYWKTVTRIYFDGEYKVPDPELLPPVPVYQKHETSDCCNVL